MPHFFCRLQPPRPSFAQDMSAAEAAAMAEHGAYWAKLAAPGGPALLFGPVADPAGFWGLLVLDARDEAEAEALTAADPAVRAGLGLSFVIHPMPQVVVRTAASCEKPGRST